MKQATHIDRGRRRARRRAAGLVALALGLALAGAAAGRGGAAAQFVHTVRPGESLSHIAVQYETSVAALAALNGLTDPDRLPAGTELLVAAAPQVHIVRPGETLSGIARRYGVQVSQLAAWNGIANPNLIRPGQELHLTAQALHHRVRAGENISVIARRYGVTVASIAQLNGLRHPDRIFAGQVLSIPASGGGVAPALGTYTGTARQAFFTVWPVEGIISSRFGPRSGRPHQGVDIAVAHGTPVRAAAAGVVAYADWAGTYGLLVKIDHGNGMETRYAHNSAIAVRAGSRVAAGDVIARAGSTGRSTGPHVHFELRLFDEAVDPLPWLP